MRSTKAEARRRLPVGAEVVEGGASFRVWAPRCRALAVVFEDGREAALSPEDDGYFAAFVEGARAGERYRLRLDGADLLPDPASRFQPEGPHGPSELVDARAFAWTDRSWSGLALPGQVFYELHVGTFTREGTWEAAARRLPELKDLGVTALEVMPVAETPGRFNWGYDGVCLFAPTRSYGRPDDFRRFVDRAHALGLGVLLDVVYNHLGPDGNYLPRFADSWFSKTHKTDWGEALNYDGPGSAGVRAFMAANAAHWIAEYHLDGLRFDATQNVYDDSPTHVLAEITAAARAAADGRSVLMVAENETQDRSLLTRHGFDAVWNDDYHHSLRVAITGRREAYYLDYAGAPQELLSAVKRGWLYQGQWYAWQKMGRGTSSEGLPARAFVTYLENHDQVANCTTRGQRLRELTSPGRLRAATALLLLGPGTPLLFQGQERGGAAPFAFFADHVPGLRELVDKGRRAFMAQFPSMASGPAQAEIPTPHEAASRDACVDERPLDDEQRRWLALHRDLLALRRDDPVIAAGRVDGAVLGSQAFCLRFFGEKGDDRLLLVNFGADAPLSVLPEPLLAAPAGGRWATLWSSEHPRYGGPGVSSLAPGAWRLPGESARLLAAADGGEDAPA